MEGMLPQCKQDALSTESLSAQLNNRRLSKFDAGFSVVGSPRQRPLQQERVSLTPTPLTPLEPVLEGPIVALELREGPMVALKLRVVTQD